MSSGRRRWRQTRGFTDLPLVPGVVLEESADQRAELPAMRLQEPLRVGVALVDLRSTSASVRRAVSSLNGLAAG